VSDISNNDQAFATALKALVSGLKLPNLLPAGLDKIAAEGKVSTVPELITEFEGYAEVYQDVADAEATYHKAVKARDLLAATAVPRYEAVRSSLKAALGKKSEDLPKVGIDPNKTPAPLTVEQKQAKVDKAKATRAARGTKGPKQLAAIKGQVPAGPPAKPGQ
jgi:hypothetical protein